MELKTLEKVLVEVKRFQKAAGEWKLRCQNDKYAEQGSKEGGTLRRASLDLTRALAELRKT